MKLPRLIELLTKERNSRINRDNPTSRFVYRAYTNIIAKVNESFNLTESITPKKIEQLPISDGMKGRLNTLIQMTDKSDATKSLKNELVKFMGLGPSKAQDLIDQGLKSVKQLKKKVWFDKLPIQTRMILENEPIRKIPHEHIKELCPSLTKIRSLKAILVGSYRRKSRYSRDIDVMLVSDKKNAIDRYVSFLKRTFKVVVYSKGDDKVSLLLDPSPILKKKSKGKFYKLDAFMTTKSYESAMLLYATGSRTFNIKMRAKAKARGYLLNQTGLFDRKTGKKIQVKSEKDFFNKLDMEFIQPENRV